MERIVNNESKKVGVQTLIWGLAILILVTVIYFVSTLVGYANKIQHSIDFQLDIFNDVSIGDSFDTVVRKYGGIPAHSMQLDDWRMVGFYRDYADGRADRTVSDNVDELVDSVGTSFFLLTDDDVVVAKEHIGDIWTRDSIDSNNDYNLRNLSKEELARLKRLYGSSKE